MLVNRRKLQELDDIIMFVAFTRSTKITIMNEPLTVSEILSCMLKQEDITWLDCPFAKEGYRPFDQIPKALQEVAVIEPYYLCAYGLFIPTPRSPSF